jgi:hypothetical protein
MSKQEPPHATDKEATQAERIAELEKEIKRLKDNQRGSSSDDTTSSLRTSNDTVLDLVSNFVRSSTDAQCEFLRAAGDVLGKIADAAQKEIRARDDEDNRDALGRLPTAIIKAVADSFPDQSSAVSKAVEKFSSSFKDNERTYKAKSGS